MKNPDRARKLLVRTALVTSTTIATLVGAQNFAMLDMRNFQVTETAFDSEPNNISVVTPDFTTTSVPAIQGAPEITIMYAAPSITILRHPGQVSVAQSSAPQVASVQVIQPPSPSRIAPPDPVIVQAAQPPAVSQSSAPSQSASNQVVVQQPAPQQSRSSR